MNAKEQLKLLMRRRKWYGGKIERRTAAAYKNKMNKGLVSYEKSEEILTLLGWKKTQDEIWEKEQPF